MQPRMSALEVGPQAVEPIMPIEEREVLENSGIMMVNLGDDDSPYRVFPRSPYSGGFLPPTTGMDLIIPGPFGKVSAIFVDNTSSYDVLLVRKNDSTDIATRIAAGTKRRMEFDTPTDTFGKRLQQMELTLASVGTDADAAVYLEVE